LAPKKKGENGPQSGRREERESPLHCGKKKSAQPITERRKKERGELLLQRGEKPTLIKLRIRSQKRGGRNVGLAIFPRNRRKEKRTAHSKRWEERKKDCVLTMKEKKKKRLG